MVQLWPLQTIPRQDRASKRSDREERAGIISWFSVMPYVRLRATASQGIEEAVFDACPCSQAQWLGDMKLQTWEWEMMQVPKQQHHDL